MGNRIISCCCFETENQLYLGTTNADPSCINKAEYLTKAGNPNSVNFSKEDFKANVDYIDYKTNHYFDQVGGLNKNKFKIDVEEAKSLL